MTLISMFKWLLSLYLMFYACCLHPLVAGDTVSSPTSNVSVPYYPTLGLPPTDDILSYANNNSIMGFCCFTLSWLMPNIVTFPLEDSYHDTIFSYASEQEQEIAPHCVVKPTTTLEVQKAVFILSFLSEQSLYPYVNECGFAVKGGGQNLVPGSSNIQGGVTVDLHDLNTVNVATTNGQAPTFASNITVVGVGGGATWNQVYQKLDPLGLTVTGGSTGGVGVSGLILGGGISIFSPKTGWACDNVVNFEVVLPYGNRTDVNLTSHPDLFKALKGGSNNFGVVTRFDLVAFPVTNFVGGLIKYPISTFWGNMAALTDSSAVTTQYDRNSGLHVAIVYSSRANTWYIQNALYYTGRPSLVNSSAIHRFITITPQLSNTMRVSNMSDFAAEGEVLFRGNGSARHTTYSQTVQATSTVLETLYQVANFTIEPVANVTGLSFRLSYHPIPVSMMAESEVHGVNVMGLDASDGNLVVWQAQWTWDHEADDERVASAVGAFRRLTSSSSPITSWTHPFIHLNSAGVTQSPFAGYRATGLQTLREVSRKYDPSGVFQFAVPGGFKVPFQDPVSVNSVNIFGGWSFFGGPGRVV